MLRCLVLLAWVSGLLLVGAAHADNILVNDGLAPPAPGHVFADALNSGDSIYTRNVGCGAPGFEGSSCSSPGAPTETALVPGGAVLDYNVRDTSVGTISGGEVGRNAGAWESATLTMIATQPWMLIHSPKNSAPMKAVMNASVRA